VYKVKRRAKVGEYIKISKDADILIGCKPGDVIYIDGHKQKPDTDGFIYGCNASFVLDEYAVLADYKEGFLRRIARMLRSILQKWIGGKKK
jgi:hypothetical protein